MKPAVATASLLLSCSLSYGAATITTPAVPVSPTSMQQCDQLSADWAEVSKQPGQEHSRCIQSPQCNLTKKDYQGPCQCIACEEWHRLMLRVNDSDVMKLRNEQVANCRQQVRAYEKAEREAFERALGPAPRPPDPHLPGPSAGAAAPEDRTLDLTVRPVFSGPGDPGAAILRERAEAPIIKREHQQAVIEGILNAIQFDRNEISGESAAIAVDAGLRALGVKTSRQREEEALEEARKKELEDNIHRELAKGEERDRNEMESRASPDQCAILQTHRGVELAIDDPAAWDRLNRACGLGLR